MLPISKLSTLNQVLVALIEGGANVSHLSMTNVTAIDHAIDRHEYSCAKLLSRCLLSGCVTVLFSTQRLQPPFFLARACRIYDLEILMLDPENSIMGMPAGEYQSRLDKVGEEAFKGETTLLDDACTMFKDPLMAD